MTSRTVARLRAGARHLRSRWIMPICTISGPRRAVRLYRQFWADWRHYVRLPGSEPIRFLNTYPCLFDRTAVTEVDAHYFYQAAWAARAIRASGAAEHVDVGSDLKVAGMLTAITRVTFVDIRPPAVTLPDFVSRPGDITALPFADRSLPSVSCLHVAEHVGLGRYGDALDPAGTRKAAAELARVLAPGGHLYFSLPVGRPRLCFNAHRIHAPQEIIAYFAGLRLAAFAAVDDWGRFHEDADPAGFGQAVYACGMFHFVRQV